METTIDLLKAVILGIVEGATEFLPVSSTGHLIVAADILRMTGPSADTFAIFIQLGAVLAVAWDRRETLLSGLLPAPRLATLLLIAFLPAAVFGVLVHDIIKSYLMSSSVVAWSLIAGAIAILIIERRTRTETVDNLAGIGWRHALAIGLFQCAAFVPGVSRAAATIMAPSCSAGSGRSPPSSRSCSPSRPSARLRFTTSSRAGRC